MAMEESLRAVENAIKTNSPPRTTDVVTMLDGITSLLEQAKDEVEEIKRRLSLIQRTLGTQL